MGGFPSGQRGQTVNLLSTTSVVRIHHLPPKKRVQICALFCFARRIKAFLPEEGGTAQAVTEGAARWQIRIRANLMRILPICKTPSVLPQGGNPAPSRREPALSVAARHLSQREKTPQSLRDSSPFRGAKSASPERGGGPRQRWRGRTESKNPALSVAARHLSQRERQVGIARKRKEFAPVSRRNVKWNNDY